MVTRALLRAGREAIQLRLSAPFSLLTTKPVKENGSKLQNTLAAVTSAQYLNMRRSMNWYSNNCCWYPFTKIVVKNLSNACGRLCSDTTRTSGSFSSTINLKNDSFLSSIATVTTKSGDKLVLLSRPHKDPDGLSTLRKLHATVPVRFDPIEHLNEEAGVHYIYNMDLKLKQQKFNTGRYELCFYGRSGTLPKTCLMTTSYLRSLTRRSKWTETRVGGPVHNYHPTATLSPGMRPWQESGGSLPQHQKFSQLDPQQMGVPCQEQPTGLKEFGCVAAPIPPSLPSKLGPSPLGFSSLSQWSRAKWFTPWNCRRISCGAPVSTKTSFTFMGQRKWTGFRAASVAPVTKMGLNSSTFHFFFILYA